MAISPDDLQRQLCDQLCAAVRVERRPDGELMLAADFEFPDGDRYPIYLSETPGGVRLSDKGETLTRISYDHDIDAFLAGSRGLLIERILGRNRSARTGGCSTSMHPPMAYPTPSFGTAAPSPGSTTSRSIRAHGRFPRSTTTLRTSSSRRPGRNGSSATTCFRTFPTPRLSDRLSIGGKERWPGVPLWRSEPGQGPPDHDHPVSLSPRPPRLRLDSGLQRSSRNPPDGPGEALGCGRGHGFVAGVA